MLESALFWTHTMYVHGYVLNMSRVFKDAQFQKFLMLELFHANKLFLYKENYCSKSAWFNENTFKSVTGETRTVSQFDPRVQRSQDFMSTVHLKKSFRIGLNSFHIYINLVQSLIMHNITRNLDTVHDAADIDRMI